MKPLHLLLATAALWPACPNASAAELRNAGILGNSGEQGASLVRFGGKPATGMGVVFDNQGALWDRGGDGALNRYAPDGRLLGSWKIASNRNPGQRDGIVLIGETLLFKVDKKLYTLPVNAAPGAAPTALPVEVTHLSTRAQDGWAAAAKEGEVFLVNLAGEKRPVATINGSLLAVELGPEGGVYAHLLTPKKENQVQRLDAAAPENARGPWPQPGGRMQWLNGHWFGNDYHGTIRRFTPEFKPAPGVVLGGRSGSFIGYVPGNYELDQGSGLAHLGGNLYAVSGRYGVMHLLEWRQADQRFEIIRRIGAAPSCPAVGLDSEGRIWFAGGVWQWSDGPDAPLQHGNPLPPGPGPFAALTTDDDRVVVPTLQSNGGGLVSGKLDGPSTRGDVGDQWPKDSVAAALVQWDKKRALLAVNAAGKGAASFLDLGNRKPTNPAGTAELQAKTPLHALSSLASDDRNSVLAAADGQIVEFASQAGNAWTESRRWISWGAGPKDRFGSRIFAAWSKGRLWVSDSDEHRVLCFDTTSGQPVLVGAFGVAGKAGDDMASLNRPETISANGSRAVVFDSGNQRLVRLELFDGAR